jgi:hypothetical protein
MVTYVFFLRAYLQSALSGTRVLQAKLEFFFIADSRDLKDRSRTCLFVFACAFPWSPCQGRRALLRPPKAAH